MNQLPTVDEAVARALAGHRGYERDRANDGIPVAVCACGAEVDPRQVGVALDAPVEGVLQTAWETHVALRVRRAVLQMTREPAFPLGPLLALLEGYEVAVLPRTIAVECRRDRDVLIIAGPATDPAPAAAPSLGALAAAVLHHETTTHGARQDSWAATAGPAHMLTTVSVAAGGATVSQTMVSDPRAMTTAPGGPLAALERTIHRAARPVLAGAAKLWTEEAR